MGKRKANILLIEDSESDAKLVEVAFRQATWVNKVMLYSEGEDALAYLRSTITDPSVEKPDLVLLDLHLPGLSGFEILDVLKSDESLRRIPVVMLTTSSSPDDIRKSYDLHANSYICKPSDFKVFSKALTTLEEFWFHVSSLDH